MFSKALIACVLGALGTAASSASADVVVDGTIYRLGGDAIGSWSTGGVISTIDHIGFTVNTAGTITMDLRSWEFDFNTNTLVDVNGDGEYAFIDPTIYLFRNDGSLDIDDYIEMNDDSQDTFGDGSVFGLDSYLSLDLAQGNYILTVGGYFNTAADAVAGINPGNGSGFCPTTCDANGNLTVSDHGDYRATITGDVTLVPAPSAAALLGLGGLVATRRRR